MEEGLNKAQGEAVSGMSLLLDSHNAIANLTNRGEWR